MVGGVLLTYSATVVANVLFRSNSCADAFQLLSAMIGLQGLWPGLFADDMLLSGALKTAPGVFAGQAPSHLLADAAVLFLPVIVGLAWVWSLPNTQQILGQVKPGEALARGARTAALLWRPNLAWALWLGAIAMLSIGSFEKLQRFIYFQF
jgi:hypothetical protein